MRCSVGVYVCLVCLTVFVNSLVKQFTMCLGVVAILLLNVMDVFSVGVGAWSSKECTCYASDPSVHLGFVYVVVCWKLPPHLRVSELDHRCFLSLCCFCV